MVLAEDLGAPKVRDVGLLDSAAHRPQSSLMGQDAYPTLHEKAAVLLESVVRNDSLVDGNKRLAWMATFRDIASGEQPTYFLAEACRRRIMSPPVPRLGRG